MYFMLARLINTVKEGCYLFSTIIQEEEQRLALSKEEANN